MKPPLGTRRRSSACGGAFLRGNGHRRRSASWESIMKFDFDIDMESIMESIYGDH